jgi:hypothetical protein
MKDNYKRTNQWFCQSQPFHVFQLYTSQKWAIQTVFLKPIKKI